MELKVSLQSNPWINAGIASFYEFRNEQEEIGSYHNPKVDVIMLSDGILIKGEEIDIIKDFNNLLDKFAQIYLYMPEGHQTEYIAYDGKRLRIMKGPKRFNHIEILRIIGPTKKPDEYLTNLNETQKKELGRLYKQIIKNVKENEKQPVNMNKDISKVKVIDASISGHPRFKIDFNKKALIAGDKKCFICGRNNQELINPSGNIFPLFYGQGNITFDPGGKRHKQICLFCEFFSYFAFYTLVYNSSRKGNLTTINCFLPSAKNLNSLIIFIKPLRKIMVEERWSNFKTEMPYAKKINESYLALMYEVTKQLRTYPNEVLEELELSQPELFYLKIYKTGQNPSVKDSGVIQNLTYIIELFNKGENEKQDINFRKLFWALLPKDENGKPKGIKEKRVNTFLRDSIAQKITNLEPIIFEIESLVSESNDNYSLKKFLKFYLKEVISLDFDINLVEGIGKSIGQGAAADQARMKVIHEIRGSNSYDQLLTSFMKVQGRLVGKRIKWKENEKEYEKEIEFYKLNDFLKQITKENWREIRALLVIFATSEFEYRKKQNK